MELFSDHILWFYILLWCTTYIVTQLNTGLYWNCKKNFTCKTENLVTEVCISWLTTFGYTNLKGGQKRCPPKEDQNLEKKITTKIVKVKIKQNKEFL